MKQFKINHHFTTVIYVSHFYVSLLNHEPYFYTSFLIQEPFSFRLVTISFPKWIDINQTCHDLDLIFRHLLDPWRSPLPKRFDINEIYRDSRRLDGYPSERMDGRWDPSVFEMHSRVGDLWPWTWNDKYRRLDPRTVEVSSKRWRESFQRLT